MGRSWNIFLLKIPSTHVVAARSQSQKDDKEIGFSFCSLNLKLKDFALNGVGLQKGKGGMNEVGAVWPQRRQLPFYLSINSVNRYEQNFETTQLGERIKKNGQTKNSCKTFPDIITIPLPSFHPLPQTNFFLHPRQTNIYISHFCSDDPWAVPNGRSRNIFLPADSIDTCCRLPEVSSIDTCCRLPEVSPRKIIKKSVFPSTFWPQANDFRPQWSRLTERREEELMKLGQCDEFSRSLGELSPLLGICKS
ncbi:hypothetical protein CEXT_230221 [Caerostris extrusa]|uniref:Uncharacterized protein n=1 Tax=Caerostris extrusa TaxID=172846 RepID=A0AAV4NRX8_CAEEX|nr:hypothetical protein CEXT_230221 [Caerostris extrusa]